MFFANGFVYGGEPTETIRVKYVKPLKDRIMLVTFNNDEERVFDSTILSGPVFAPLQDEDVFSKPEIDHGVVTWNNGEIDCAPEFMYQHSFEYSRI